MGKFPGFGGWINQDTQQPPKAAESKRSENVKPKSMSEINTHKERDDEMMKEQLKLWRVAEKKEQWNDPPAKVKVETRNDLEWGTWTMDIEFTLGLPPEAAYDVLTNPDNEPSSRLIKGRELLENISRKVVSPDTGKGQIVETKKAVAWNFLCWSGAIPIKAIFIEHRKSLTVQYSIKNKMFIKKFEGMYKVEPLYVDSERLCKHKKPKSREEYSKCSGGQGRIASKVKMDQMFKPSLFFNVPPLSWYIRRITIKTIKILIQDLQATGFTMRDG